MSGGRTGLSSSEVEAILGEIKRIRRQLDEIERNLIARSSNVDTEKLIEVYRREIAPSVFVDVLE